MPVSISIQKSLLSFPHKILHHHAFAWRDMILVLGEVERESVVYCLHSGTWVKKETTGDIPRQLLEKAHIINDTLVVLGTTIDVEIVHTLNLKTWVWTRLYTYGTPGTLPSTMCGVCTWVHKGRIYCFGGGTFDLPSNQLLCYDPSNNTWQKITQMGDIPSPRDFSEAVVRDDTVYLFGGRVNTYVNDLFILEMGSMTWKKIHGKEESGNVPRNSNFQRSFILVSRSVAVYFGLIKTAFSVL